MSDDYIFRRETMGDVMVATAEANVAASLAAGLLRRDDSAATAVAVYREVLAALRESGGL